MAKIVLLHYSAPPIVGGVESVIAHQARLMAEHGHAVRVIAGRGGQFEARVQFDKLPLADSRHPQVLAVKSKLDQGERPPEFNRLVGEIENALSGLLADADILILHNVCSLNKNLALTAALHKLCISRKKPHMILWHHDLAWTTPRYRAELHPGYPWELLKQAWPGATQVAVSDLRRQELAELMQIGEEAVCVVPNGIEPAEFLKLDEQTNDFAGKLNLWQAAPLLLLPVRITPRKNIEFALQVLAHLKATFAEVRLVVTGPLGPHNPANVEYFQRLVELRKSLGLIDKAHFLAELTNEFIPDRVIADFYELADALLLPSREEGFGLPLLEAGLAGMPVFCADIPPLRKLGGEHVSYFALNAQAEQVADMIAASLNSSPVFGLRTRVMENYTWERVYLEKIAPLLQEATANSGPPGAEAARELR